MFAKIKETVDCVRHIGTFVQLRGTRMPMEAQCCFHDDRSPSFKVWADHWWCFGCGEGGTVIDFEMKRQGMSPVDAARWLCNAYNIVVSREESERYAQAEHKRQEKTAIAKALADSGAQRPELLDYLVKERGFSLATIKDMGFGVGMKEKVIVVPIKDKYGRVVAFARRHLDPEQVKMHKWVNDPESDIYQKKTILYNLDLARRALPKATDHLASGQRLVLVESYFDCAALWEAGIKTGVAYCSANVTTEQCQEIKGLVTPGMTIMFGACNDKTAQDKLLVNRTMIRSVAPEVHIRAVVIPDDCKDMNDVLLKHGAAGLQKIVGESISMDQYLLDQILDSEPVLDIQYRKAKQIVSVAENSMSQKDMILQLSKRWSKDEATVSHYMLGKGEEAAGGLQFDNITSLITKYENYTRDLDKNVIKFGWAPYDKITRMHRGDVVQLVAPSGVGKTTWAEQLMLSIGESQPDVPMIFYSMEQQGIMAFERFMQMEGTMESRDVEKWMIAGDAAHNSKIFNAAQRLTSKLKNLLVCDQGGLTMAQIEAHTRQAGFAYFGRPVGTIFIDYLGYLKGDGGTIYEIVSNIAREQKEVAKRLGSVVVSLHQTTKAGKAGEPIDESHARDSSAIRDSADILITAWRPELKEGLLDAEKAELSGIWRSRIAKNRYGPANGIVDFTFVPQFLKLKPMEDRAVTEAFAKPIKNGPLPTAPGFTLPTLTGGF